MTHIVPTDITQSS